MKISVMDASNYLKGLLLLLRKDGKITQPEIELMKRIGQTLGFEKKFCDSAIQEILGNKYIMDVPPEFSTKELAIKFIRDGLCLAFSDDEVHPFEEQWLRSTAEKNGLDLNFFARECANATNRNALPARLESDDLTIDG